jgi:hypothetical protein
MISDANFFHYSYSGMLPLHMSSFLLREIAAMNANLNAEANVAQPFPDGIHFLALQGMVISRRGVL